MTRANWIETTDQWRIQDFPDARRQPLSLGQKNLLLGKIFAENCMKMKEIGQKGVEGSASLAPFGSANELGMNYDPLTAKQES